MPQSGLGSDFSYSDHMTTKMDAASLFKFNCYWTFYVRIDRLAQYL